jgi:hypothetical protein
MDGILMEVYLNKSQVAGGRRKSQLDTAGTAGVNGREIGKISWFESGTQKIRNAGEVRPVFSPVDRRPLSFEAFCVQSADGILEPRIAPIDADNRLRSLIF